MDPSGSGWRHLHDFCRLAEQCGVLEVWLFGSAMSSGAPADLDVLVLYEDRDAVVTLRRADCWDTYRPPISLLAMTRQEESFYDFISATGAMRLA